MDGKNINHHIEKDIILLTLGWQQRIVSLMTTGQLWVKSSLSEEFLSPGVPWCGLTTIFILAVVLTMIELVFIHFIFAGQQQAERDL